MHGLRSDTVFGRCLNIKKNKQCLTYPSSPRTVLPFVFRTYLYNATMHRAWNAVVSRFSAARYIRALLTKLFVQSWIYHGDSAGYSLGFVAGHKLSATVTLNHRAPTFSALRSTPRLSLDRHSLFLILWLLNGFITLHQNQHIPIVLQY